MHLSDFLEVYAQHPAVQSMVAWAQGSERHASVVGLVASAMSLAVAALHRQLTTHIIVVMDDEEAAAYCYHDLTQLFGKEIIAYFPSAYRSVHKHGTVDDANEILRTDTLAHLQHQQPCVVVTYPDALCEKVPETDDFNKTKIEISMGNTVDSATLTDMLDAFGFEPVDFVFEPGQYAQRGSIIDIFSYTNELPYRIDLLGDNVESIRTFDIEKQLSVAPQQHITIVPNIDGIEGRQISLLEFAPADALLLLSNTTLTRDRIDQVYDAALVKANALNNTPNLEARLIRGTIFMHEVQQHRTLEFGKTALNASVLVKCHITPQPLFHKNFDLVAHNLRQYLDDGYTIYITSDSKKQIDRIAAIFADRGDALPFTPVLQTVHEGFIDHDMCLCCYTDHQIFDRFHKFALRSDVARSGKVAMTLKELNQFKIGDYVVHIDHGIGKFGGLLTTNINGKPQEVIKLIYKDNDVIFVSIHALHRISKYKSKEGETPRINKLGTGAWERLKERTKSKVKDIARDLIRLYAQRMTQKGFAYSPDSYLQHELEASFVYEDTPDQVKTTADIKHDMESERPMDRLVCGDVGFGKTEVAIRAAFKAVTDGKQVAVLVPTTVLALQHYKTFSDRLQLLPCTVAYLSRAKSAQEVKEILKQLADGKIDILIGTHKIIGKEVKFHDLGLLIIDEEQKFGVSVKEKLKQLKVNVDTLTLTATPIPRTLQFSLMGARDLSVINTPPPNRYPVLTEVIEYDESIIAEAINNEMSRNGQVFFIHNRVQNIYTLHDKLKRIVPEARIAVAHGQMPTQKLEETIVDFLNYDYDVLLATTVVESGIDMPNVNTIIVDHANMFGLSDLHQLRGRVGRSNRKAYCYLIAPPMKEMTDDARRRLQAIETFAELGSGFNIAMQDLDIRGAGNMLGAEQSGFIADLGYETYQRILGEAMTELRNEEFADLFADKHMENIDYVTDAQVETDLNLLLPADYVENISERMTLYRELDGITTEQGLQNFAVRLNDRFGALPPEALELMEVVRLRWQAVKMGIERMVLKNGRMVAYLVANLQSPFYKSEIFGKMVTYYTTFPNNCRMSENNGKRMMVVSPVTSVATARRVLDKIMALDSQ